jgi:hypothetical protein
MDETIQIVDSTPIEPLLPDASPQSVEAINRQRRHFSAMRTANLSRYLERERTSCTNPRLVVLNGWSDTSRPTPQDPLPPQLLHHLLKGNNESIVRCGGYWVQLGGLGIVINPGRWFLERFHKAGLHIWDIDHVIITDGKESSSFDLERLWTFNREINTLLKEWELAPHVISYWLHPSAFERCAPGMRPLFRQERSTVHRLETFHDISAFETIELNDKISLDYSSAAPTSESLSPLMVRLRPLQENRHLSIGFLSQAPWHEAQNAFLSSCQTAVLGIGETSFEEIASLTPNPSSLGYSGVIKILDNEAIRLAVIAEQGFSEGDIRIESLKRLREELHRQTSTVIPAEEGTTIYLDSLHMTAPGLQTPTSIRSIRVMRSEGSFSRLAFLDEAAVL